MWNDHCHRVSTHLQLIIIIIIIIINSTHSKTNAEYVYHSNNVNCSSVTFADKIMEGQNRNLAVIYEPTAGITESREGLGDNNSGNGRTSNIP
jgi:hypothetical protein